MKDECTCCYCTPRTKYNEGTFHFDSHMAKLQAFGDRLNRDLEELPDAHPRWDLFYRQPKAQLKRQMTPPTQEENDVYWAEVYAPQPDCNGCGHPHREHWYPENFPMSVVCHVGNCQCGDYT